MSFLFGLNPQPIFYDRKKKSYIYSDHTGDNLIPRVSHILQVIDKDFRIPWALKEMGNYVDRSWDPTRIYAASEKKQIISDSKGEFERISFRAMDRGTATHKWIQQHINRESPAWPGAPEVASAVQRFLEWEKQEAITWIVSELTVASPSHWFAGTIDFIAIWHDELVLGDFKVAKRISKEYFLQTMGYLIAFEELLKESFYNPSPQQKNPELITKMSEDEFRNLHLLWNFLNLEIMPMISRRVIVHIPIDGGPVNPIIVPTDPQKDRQGFLAACAMYQWLQHAKDKYKDN